MSPSYSNRIPNYPVYPEKDYTKAYAIFVHVGLPKFELNMLSKEIDCWG